jgi:ABC-2 type transport system ATP-binding protein
LKTKTKFLYYRIFSIAEYKRQYMTNVIIRAENLVKTYDNLHAVNNLSLDVMEGEIYGFLGPNGAGKTTSINMICGQLKPDSGQIFIQGVPLKQSTRELRAKIGVCPQNITLWGRLTCMEQLEFFGECYGVERREARRRGEVLLEAVGLAEKRNRLASTLSGGMQRRLNLILALVHDPVILILDEPEAGLDPQGRILVREYIRSWASRTGRTVILTTHDMDEAERLARRVAIIDHGKMLVVDTPKNLKNLLGEGDVLEIDLKENGGNLQGSLEIIASLAPQASLVKRTLILHLRGAIDHINPIMDRLKSGGYLPGEIRLRENTLEDVFISLTGRRLRE